MYLPSSIYVLALLLFFSFSFAQSQTISESVNKRSLYIDASVKGVDEHMENFTLQEDVFHLFAHGRSGELFIQDQWMALEDIIDFLKPLILDPAGSSKFSYLNIYACNFAEGDKGLLAMKKLQSFFTGGVAASNNKVGNESLGGDWEMEIVIGSSKNVCRLPKWEDILQITFAPINSYTTTATLANFNCAGFTTMDASLVYNNAPLTITFSCPVTSASIPIMSLGDSNVEVYSFDAVGAPETLSTTCPNVTITGNTVTNNTGSAGISGVEFYLDLSSTTPFTQIIVTKISGSFAAGVMNPSSGYWTDPCVTNVPCTTPSPCNVSGPPTLTAGGTASFNSGTPTPAGTTSSWTISPTTGVSTSSGSGSVAGSISFANAGTFTVTFTHTNSSSPSACFPSDSSACATVITVNGPCVTVTDSSNLVACDSAQINGSWYFVTQSVNNTFIGGAANGCDSAHTTDLTIINPSAEIDTINACGSHTWIDGNTYFTNNTTASYTLTGANTCDSVVTLNLTIFTNILITDTLVSCDSLTWIDGNTYTSSNNTATHILANPTGGCDTIVTLDLTINQSSSETDIITSCDSLLWIDGNTYTANNNTATHILTGANGCDSVITLNLTIQSNILITDTQVACDSFTWIDGVTYTASNNTATHLLANTSGGCDTIVTLDLTINGPSFATDIINSCDPLIWIDGNTYTTSNNTATQTLTGLNGCDSILTLNLTISVPDTTMDFRFACDSLTWIDGVTYSSSNSAALYTIFGGSSDGCDSVVALNLQILPTRYGSDTLRTCDSIAINNTWYFSSQTVMDTFLSNASCDSIATTYIIIESSATVPVIEIDTVLCIGEVLTIDAIDFYGLAYNYRWENNPVNSIFETEQSGSYNLTLIDSQQCEYSREALFLFEDCSEQCKVLAPTGFSPNEDGQNDVFKIFRICEAAFNSWDVKIYNRWGELVFKSDDFEDPWDGTYKAKLAPIGVYSYSVEYTIEGSSEKKIVKGVVTLIR